MLKPRLQLKTWAIPAKSVIKKTTFISMTEAGKEIDMALLFKYILYIYHSMQFKKD